jgi:hypothetical protein
MGGGPRGRAAARCLAGSESSTPRRVVAGSGWVHGSRVPRRVDGRRAPPATGSGSTQTSLCPCSLSDPWLGWSAGGEGVGR